MIAVFCEDCGYDRRPLLEDSDCDHSHFIN